MARRTAGEKATDEFLRAAAEEYRQKAALIQPDHPRRAKRYRDLARHLLTFTHDAEDKRRERLDEAPLHDNLSIEDGGRQVTGDTIAARFAAFEHEVICWDDLRELCKVAHLPLRWFNVTELVVRYESSPQWVADQCATLDLDYPLTASHVQLIVGATVNGLWRAAQGDPYHEILVYSVLREVFGYRLLSLAGYG